MDMVDVVKRLEEVGLPRDLAECYVQLASLGESSAGQLAKRLPTSRAHVYKTLRGLAEAGHVRTIVGRPLRYRAISPPELFRTFAESAKARLHLIERAETELTPTLAHLPRATDDGAGIGADVVTTRARVFANIRRLLDCASRDVKVVMNHPRGFWLMDASGAWARMSGLVRRGVRVRVVAGADLAERPLIQNLAREGLEFGLIHDPHPMGAVVVDDSQALTMLRADATSRGLEQAESAALLTNSGEFVHLCSRLFEAQWKDCPKVFRVPLVDGNGELVVAS